MHPSRAGKASTRRWKRSGPRLRPAAHAVLTTTPIHGGFRAALLVGVSVLAATGALFPPTPAVAQPCVPSNQVIATSIPGPVNSDGGSVTITASGSVGNGGVAVGCAATRVDNAGNVSGVTVQTVGSVGALTNHDVITGTNIGISNGGTISQLGNSGVINGVDDGSGTAASGLSNTGSIGQLSNSGVINGVAYSFPTGIGISNTGSITQLSNSGAINGIGNNFGIGIFNFGSIGQLSNTGTIIGAGTGLSNGGVISQLGNSGTISSIGNNGFGIFNFGTISHLSNSGTISGADTGLSNTGMISQLLNRGIISGSGNDGFGIFNYVTIGELSNSGTIIGAVTGIANNGVIGQLSNSGSISGILNSGTISQLDNSGTIGGTGGTAIANLGSIGPLNNSGTISSSGAYALISSDLTVVPFCPPDTLFGCGPAQSRVINAVIGPITNSGVIAGSIEIRHQDVTIFGGSGNTFGELTGGTMTIPDGNLWFAAGNQLLAQNVTVNHGQGTVTNSGNLMLASPQSITGNYVQGSAGSLIIGIGAGTAGRLDVSGTATFLGATVVPRLLGPIGSYVLPLGQRLQVVTAQGGFLGGGVSLMQPAGLGDTGVRFDLPIDPPGSLSVVLTPSKYGNLAALGIVAGAAASAVGSSLDAARPPAGAAMTPGELSLYTPLYALAEGQIAPTLQQMAPVIYADALTVNRSTFQMVSTAINQELDVRRGAPAATYSSTQDGGSGDDDLVRWHRSVP